VRAFLDLLRKRLEVGGESVYAFVELVHEGVGFLQQVLLPALVGVAAAGGGHADNNASARHKNATTV